MSAPAPRAATGAASQVERAMEALRLAVVRGDYGPGDRLKEADVAAALRMSRTPIREALRRLAGEGIVEYEANRGAVVPRWSRHEVEEIFEIRAYLEGFAAALAADRVTADDLASLRALSREMHAAADLDDPARWDRYALLNNAFHRRLFACAGNSRLEGLLVGLLAVPLLHRSFDGHSLPALHRSNAHHDELLEALEAREPKWAQAVVRAHVHATRHLLSNGWEDHAVDP